MDWVCSLMKLMMTVTEKEGHALSMSAPHPHLDLRLVMFMFMLCLSIFIDAHFGRNPVNSVMCVVIWSNTQQPFRGPSLAPCWPTVHYCKCACSHVMSRFAWGGLKLALCVYLWIAANFWQGHKGGHIETKRTSSLTDQSDRHGLTWPTLTRLPTHIHTRQICSDIAD